MLQKSSEKFLRRQRYRFEAIVCAVAIPEGYSSIGALHNRAIRKRSLMDVAPQIFKHLLGALNAWFAEYVPLPFLGQTRQLNRWYRSPSKVQKSSAELLCQCLDWHEKFFLPTSNRQPSTVVVQRPSGYEHMDMWMLLKRT